MTVRKPSLPDPDHEDRAGALQAASSQASVSRENRGAPSALNAPAPGLAAAKASAAFGGSETLHPAKIENAEQRRQRLAAQLRANLVKRKAQARARAQADVAQSEAGGDT